MEIYANPPYVGGIMHTAPSFFLSALLPVIAMSGAPAVAQGRLGLLPQGEYICSLPGNAGGAAWQEVPEQSFTVTGSSGYRMESGKGTYLKEGKRVTFTRGPLRNRRMLQVSPGMLQEIDRDGNLGRLRCHRTGASTD